MPALLCPPLLLGVSCLHVHLTAPLEQDSPFSSVAMTKWVSLPNFIVKKLIHPQT